MSSTRRSLFDITFACSGTRDFNRRDVPTFRQFSLRRCPLFTMLLCVVAVAGCSSNDNPFDLVKVTGKVTYEDGTPIPGDQVIVWFHPQVDVIEEKIHPRPAQGEVKPDGTFDTLTTAVWGDGVIKGTQKVVVQALDGSGEPTRAVPRQYHQEHTTPIEVTISSGSEPLEIKVAKPN